LDVLTARQLSPEIRLDSLATSGDAEVACAALGAARRFPALLETASLQRALRSRDHLIRNAAIETGLVLGVPEAWPECEHAFVEQAAGWETVALWWALGASTQQLGSLIQALELPGHRRAAIWALGFSGRIEAAEALRGQMRDPEFAPLAAEAFSAITGLPLAPPFVLPAEAETRGESTGPEADLPQPAIERIEQWWKEARSHFKTLERYLGGKPWGSESLLSALEHHPMRRRPALALELAIRTGGNGLLDTGAFSGPQRRQMERLRAGLGPLPGDPFLTLGRRASLSLPPPSRTEPPASSTRAPVSSDMFVITGLGMVTAIGHGAVESCASLRAQIVRPRPLPFQVLSSDEMGARAATGHCLHGLVEGFTGLARLVKLGGLALEDLIRAADLPVSEARFLHQTALSIGLSPTRQDEWDFYDEFLAEKLPERLLRHAGLAIPAQNVSVLRGGHASGLLALQQGMQLLRSQQFQRVIVLGIDSLVEDHALQWLASRRRLKTPEQAVGLMPGEAGAAVLLERPAEAKRRTAQVQGLLTGLGSNRIQDMTSRKGAESGRALAQAIRQAWPASIPVGDLYGDLNGEQDRAMEWGCAQVLLRETHDLDAMRLFAPAECLGDTGSASGLIALGAALRSFARGYAGGQHALVWSSSDSGEFAAARLSHR
jgi:hypothetical protein